MKGVSMSDWFTVQLFVTDDGACEVLGHVDDYRKLRCTCLAFASSRRCKHTKYMKKYMEENDGQLKITVPKQATDEEVEFAMTSSERFRELVIKYGKVEYLP